MIPPFPRFQLAVYGEVPKKEGGKQKKYFLKMWIHAEKK
jgi:hypothetical protein